MKQVVLAIVVIVSIGILRDHVPQRFRMVQMQFREPDAKLTMPVTGVAARRVVNTWKAPRSGGRRHEGQDIFAKRGTPVVSATNGIVIRVGTNTLGGNVVSVVGNGGRVYYYAHLDRYAEGISAGDEVLAGDTLGYVGTTGNARGTPPHLHFGVYTATGAINPLPLLVETNPIVSRTSAAPKKPSRS